MIRAHALGMASGDYQFLFIKTTLLSNEEIAKLESTALWEYGDSKDLAARQGFENLLYVRPNSFVLDGILMLFITIVLIGQDLEFTSQNISLRTSKCIK
jgi:hypothetical protein